MKITDLYPANKIVIREVGLRDGLQLVKQWPSTENKRRWLEIDYAAGLRHFEVGSFLPASAAPQFADVEEMIPLTRQWPDAYCSALILNPRGAARALQTEVDEITAVISASETHNMANIRRSRAQSISELRDVIRLRDASDRKPCVTVGIAMAFGCSMEGDIAASEVLRIAEECAAGGADAIYVADTVGYGGPVQVRRLIAELRKLVGDLPLGMHFHDTRGLGLANAAAALDEGVTILDASLAGLGGCPFAPSASGNIVLEDLIFLAKTMGYDLPIDLEKLVKAREVLLRSMPDEPLYGAFAKAGSPLGKIAFD